jgi:hypothetical protein
MHRTTRARRSSAALLFFLSAILPAIDCVSRFKSAIDEQQTVFFADDKRRTTNNHHRISMLT